MKEGVTSNMHEGRMATGKRIGFLVGAAVAIVMLLVPAPGALSPEAWRTAAIGSLMAIWWITEALPIPATALVPLVLFPLLGIASMSAAASPFANETIFLFMGGFIIAAALEACGLHRRIAVTIIGLVGTRPANLIGGFMLATAFLSMWVSNTATVVMVLPMATSVIIAIEEGSTHTHAYDNFSIALLLGIAYAASIGGVGTLIGTPPTALLAAFMSESYGIQIGFLQWMFVGMPVVIVGLPLTWLILTRILHPVGHTTSEQDGEVREAFDRVAVSLGPMSRTETTVACIATLVAIAWVTRPILERVLPGISDAGIAMTGALLMFLVPTNWKRGEFPLRWQDADRIPWAILVLFGGGLSLAAAVQATGLAQGIGNAMAGFGAWPVPLIVFAVTVIVILLTELTSNTATAATFLPIVASVSLGLGHPALLLAAPAAMAAGLSFMMPVGTPPNALVFATGRLTIPMMARAGILLNVLFAILIQIATFLIALRVLGVDAGG
jgi:sodium-dependent dicarboxylate transporter 2/3/5